MARAIAGSKAEQAYGETARHLLAALDLRPKLRGSIGVSLLQGWGIHC